MDNMISNRASDISGDKVICILGPPACGKSTVAKKFENSINIGALLRKSTDPIIIANLASGNYIDPERIMPLLKNGEMILDGFPRDRKQLQYLKALFSHIYYIELICSMDVCIARSIKRNRSDDNVIEQRLNKHNLECVFYEELQTFKIDASVGIEQVYESVKDYIFKL